LKPTTYHLYQLQVSLTASLTSSSFITRMTLHYRGVSYGPASICPPQDGIVSKRLSGLSSFLA